MNDSKVLDLALQLAGRFYQYRADFLLRWDLIIDIAIFFFGLVVMGICACRMGRLTPEHLLAPRITYVGLFTTAFSLAFAPWLYGDEYVRLGALFFCIAVIAHLVVAGWAWVRGRPPRDLETQPAPLEYPQ